MFKVELDNETDPDKKRTILERFSKTKALLYYDVGIQLIKSGRKDEAIYAFENVIEFDKDDTVLLEQVFHILSEYSENLEDVLGICEEMISQRPNFKDAYYTKFNIEQKLGLHKDAENTRNEARRIFGNPEPKKKDDMC
jgi:tetratricopeptide (TPR) repeat protein